MYKFFTKKYKGFVIEVEIVESNKVYAFSVCGKSKKYHKNIEDAIDEVKKKIDKFMNCKPKTYEDLSNILTESLKFTGYGNSYVDDMVLKVAVENFIKNREKNE